jgi:hypothetical protein
MRVASIVPQYDVVVSTEHGVPCVLLLVGDLGMGHLHAAQSRRRGLLSLASVSYGGGWIVSLTHRRGRYLAAASLFPRKLPWFARQRPM